MGDELGYWCGYLRKSCPNCGRMRMERWKNKDTTKTTHICEKCKWCLETDEYYMEGEDEMLSPTVL